MKPSLEAEATSLRSRIEQLELELNNAREQLARREAQLQLIIDNVPALLAYITPDQVYQQVNRKYREWTGREPDEIAGRAISELVGEPHITNARPWIARAIAGEQVTYESQIHNHEGELRDIFVSYTPDAGPDGTVRGFVTLVQDITDRKRTERRLTALNAEFQTLFELTPVAIGYALDSECREVRANPAMRQLLRTEGNPSLSGPERTSLPYTPTRNGVPIQPDEAPMQMAARLGIPVHDYEFTVEHADGSRVDVVGYADPLFDELGAPRGCVGVFVDITERKRSERAVAELSQRLQAHLENTPLAVVEYTPDFRILRWSREAERVFGWSADEVIGRRYDEIRWVHDEDATGVSTVVERLLSGESAAVCNSNRNYTKSEDVVHVEWYHSALYDSTGNMTSVLSFGLDVTARTRTEAALRLSEERFQTALQHAPLIVFNQDSDLRYTWIHNPAFGFTPDQVRGLTDHEILDRSYDADMVTAIKRRVLDTGVGVREEVLLHNSGRSYWFDLTVEPLRDTAGTITGVTGAVVDNTAHRELESALRHSEQRWRVLTEAMPVLVWTARPDGLSDYSNDRWLEYTGQTLEQTLGLGWMDVVYPEDKTQMNAAWRDALAHSRNYDVQYRIRRASDGEYRWHLVRAWPLKNSEGTVLKWIGTSTDIHDYTRLAEELRASNGELTRANQDLEQFAWAAAHDLQEPLRTLAIYNQLLARKYAGRLDEEADKYIGFCIDAARRMQTLVSDLLAYTRVSGRDRNPREAVDCADVVRQVLADLRPTLAEAEATVDVERLPVAFADRAQLLQLFQNLLSNAVKYRRTDVSLHIRIYSLPEGKMQRIFIQDNGSGIDPQYATRVFGIFKRLRGSDVPGTGIGLAICKRIVENYGGSIEVRSEGEGRGSTFTFLLPAVE